MLKRFARRPQPSTVIALIALVVAMSGTGYAVTQLPRNSVGTKQLKKDAVISSKVKGLRANDFAPGQLAGAWHEIEPDPTPGGSPDFLNDWENENLGYSTAAFSRDASGFVHLKGIVRQGSDTEIFMLPAGFRPALDGVFAAASDDGVSGPTVGQIYVRGPSSNSGLPNGTVEAVTHGSSYISLDGINFRCAPSGTGGCP